MVELLASILGGFGGGTTAGALAGNDMVKLIEAMKGGEAMGILQSLFGKNAKDSKESTPLAPDLEMQWITPRRLYR